MLRRHFLQRAATIAAGAAVPFPASAGAAPQFSLAHLTALGCQPPDLTRIAAATGYDFVSYRLINMNLAGEPNYDLAVNSAMRRKTRAALAATGLKLHDIEV